MARPTKEQQERKSRTFNIRLTEAEFRTLRERAKGYQSVSSFLLDATLNFDTRRGRNKIDTMIKFSDLMEKSDVALARMGNNINQVAREMNRIRKSAKETTDEQIGVYTGLFEEVLELQKMLLLELRAISNMR